TPVSCWVCGRLGSTRCLLWGRGCWVLARSDVRGLARLGGSAGVGDAAPDQPPAAGFRSRFEAAAERAHALSHPDDAQPQALSLDSGTGTEIGRASCRERVQIT